MVFNRKEKQFKVLRNTQNCINCNACSINCPQGIDVASLEMVDHKDCDLCGACDNVCPVDDALTLNTDSNFKWTPVSIITVLFFAFFYFCARHEDPKISEYWGDKAFKDNCKTLKLIDCKICISQDKVFINKLKNIEGVTGIDTYFNTKVANIWYDTTKTTINKIQKAIFKPIRISVIDAPMDSKVGIIDADIDQFIDDIYVFYLHQICKVKGNVYAFETSFNKGVKVRFYTKYNFSADSLKSVIQDNYLSLKEDDEEYKQHILLDFNNVHRVPEYITGLELKKATFLPYSASCNNRNAYSNDQITYFEVVLKRYPKNRQLMSFLLNSVCNQNRYVVGMQTYYKDEPMLRVYYVKRKAFPQEIAALFISKELKIYNDKGEVETIANPYGF